MKKIDEYKLYIFDMDGLIFDSENLYINYAPKILEKMGFDHVNNPIKKTIGVNSKTAQKIFSEFYGPSFDFEFYRNSIHNYLMDYNEKNGIKILDGVIDFLTYLNENNKTAVIASSSSKETIEKYTKRNGIDIYFKGYISGLEIKNGKPAPDIFLEIAKRFNVKACDCIVFEDSFNGIRAAKNADMCAIMIPNVLEPDDEMKKLSDKIYVSFKEILKDVLNK